MYVYPYYTLSCISSVHIYGIYAANAEIYIYMFMYREREKKETES